MMKTMEIDLLNKKMPHVGLLLDSTVMFGGVGFVMGLPIINLSGSDAQKKEWIPKIQSGEITTCYGQTELGHGSDIQSLETTAVYNEQDETFTINTPSVSSYKWWPGDMGLASNYVIVYARVFSLGKYRGMYPLFFQVRDMVTHKLFPGVEDGNKTRNYNSFTYMDDELYLNCPSIFVCKDTVQTTKVIVRKTYN